MHASVIRTLLLPLCIAFLGVPYPAAAQAQPDPFEPVRDHIRQVMEERNLPSVAVAVSRGDEILWEEGFGWADLGRSVAATPHTPYSLASISKPILATALMVTVEDGLVDLDAPVNDYLGWGKVRSPAGDASGEAEAATVRRVMSHTAGLPLHYQFFYDTRPEAPPERDETIRRYGRTVFAPGEEYVYSNLGYGILDHVLSRVTERRLDEALDSLVFRPLGMTRSAVDLPPGLEDEVAQRYDEDRRVIPFYSFDHPGASAVYASAHDLVRFGMLHLGYVPPGGRAILRPETLQAMQSRETPEGGGGYGLGWGLDEEYGFTKVSHTGSMPGVSTMLALYPSEGVAVAVLLNTVDREQRVEIGREVAAAVIDGYADARRDEEEARAAAQAAAERERAAAGDEEEDAARSLAPLVGRWRGSVDAWTGPLELELEVREDGDVHVRLGDQGETVLADARLDDGRFRGRFPGRIPTPDALRHPIQDVALDLRLRDGALRGQATALSRSIPIGFALSSPVRLERQDAGRQGDDALPSPVRTARGPGPSGGSLDGYPASPPSGWHRPWRCRS